MVLYLPLCSFCISRRTQCLIIFYKIFWNRHVVYVLNRNTYKVHCHIILWGVTFRSMFFHFWGLQCCYFDTAYERIKNGKGVSRGMAYIIPSFKKNWSVSVCACVILMTVSTQEQHTRCVLGTGCCRVLHHRIKKLQFLHYRSRSVVSHAVWCQSSCSELRNIHEAN
jgi:hypothetical protein